MDRKTIKIDEEIDFSEEMTLQMKKQIRRLFFFGVAIFILSIFITIFYFVSKYIDLEIYHFKIFVIILISLLCCEFIFILIFGIHYYRFSKYVDTNFKDK